MEHTDHPSHAFGSSTPGTRLGVSFLNDENPEDVVSRIPISNLRPMLDQPRRTFDDTSLGELAQSIKTYGILQPLIVTPEGSGTYRIIAGERRWRAGTLAGLTSLPCIIRKPDDHTDLEVALIENIQREELSPVDEALAFQRLVSEYSYTQETLAAKLGKDRSTVSNALRLLSLPQSILDDLLSKELSAGHARALCGLEEAKTQLRIAEVVKAKKLSVRQTEDLVKAHKKGRQEPRKLHDAIPGDLRQLCDQFKGHLGTKVRITGSPERGKIEISYYALEDLERISDLILGSALESALRSR